MNEILGERYVESIRRMALGLEPVDAGRRSRAPHPLRVTLDGAPLVPPRHLRNRRAGPWEPEDVLEVVPRAASSRHVLTYREGVEGPLRLRISDPRKRYVPRRLEIELADPPTLGRVCRPGLFPGPAYDLAGGAMELRGRVLRDGLPMRWARVEARDLSSDLVVGRAHGDEHGEFLLILDAIATRPTVLELPLEVQVAVFGPDDAADPAAVATSRVDPLWDLPLEPVPRTPEGERVLTGEELPAGYVTRPASVRTVLFDLDGLVREEFDFS